MQYGQNVYKVQYSMLSRNYEWQVLYKM